MDDQQSADEGEVLKILRVSSFRCSGERPAESVRRQRRVRHAALHRSQVGRVRVDGRRRRRAVAVDAGRLEPRRRDRRGQLRLGTCPQGV